MQQRPGTRDVGIEYQFKVITYAAAALSKNKIVRNFVIHSNLDNIPGFDDLVIKVWYEQEQHPYVYLGQVKHRSSKINFDGEKHKLAHYKGYIETIHKAREQIEFIKDVPVSNIEFWYFTNNFISGNVTLEQLNTNSAPSSYNVIPNPTYKSILPSEKNAICYRLSTKDLNQKKNLFDKFHFLLNQPNNWQIENKIKELCHDGFTKKMTEDIIKYVDKYFNRFKADGLTKVIFDTEVLRIHLSKFTVKPTKIIEINKNQARIWNNLTLRHTITIVEDVKDIETHLHGCFLPKINDVYDCNFKWNDCMTDGGKLGTNFDIQKFVQVSNSKNIRHWLITPETIELLLIEMWKWDDLPLILKPTNGISILSKYKHLKKRFIIIGDVEAKFNEANLFCSNIFTNAANIRSVALRNELLNGLMVSLQGRTPVRLYDVISGDISTMKEITCAQILNLIKKRTTYLQDKCLTETELSIFLIMDDVEEKGLIDLDKIEIRNSDNILINCKRKCTVNFYYNRIKYLNRYESYTVYNLLLKGNKLEILRGDKYKIRNYLIDQDGSHVYDLGKYDSIPIIGKRLGHKEHVYIQRAIRMPTLLSSILDIQEQRICFLCGDIQYLDTYIKKQIVTEFSECHIKNYLEMGRNAIFNINNDTIEEQWIKLDTSPAKHQLFHLRVVDRYTLELLKYKNCPNIDRYLDTSRKCISENKFFGHVFRFTKVIVISAETGMGKTLLLQSLAEICNKKDFVVLFNLAHCRNDLHNDNKELLESPLEFIFKKVEPSQAFLNLLNQICNLHKTNGRLVLLLDSFDEVAQFYAEKVLSLIENILKLNIRIIISSKTANANILCDKFQVNPIQISGLDKANVKTYTTGRNSADIDLTNIPLTMIENPLFLNLFCYLHQQGYPKMSTNMYDLYKQVWHMKIKRYYNKNKLDCNFKIVEDNLLKNHQLMALISVFGKDMVISKTIIKDFDTFIEKFNNFDIHLGFINSIHGNIPIFVHPAIAVALAIEWVYENLLIDVAAQDIYRIIVQRNEFTDIRCTFDSLLCKDINLHQAVIKEDTNLVQQLCTKSQLSRLDKCGRNALHLAVSYCKGYFNETNFKIVEILIKSMLENKCDLNQEDTFLKWNWVDYANFYNQTFFYFACVHGSKATVDLYLNRRKDDDLSILKRWRSNASVFNQFKIVLQEVLINDHADICRMLLKKVTSLSRKDLFDSTTIHLATKAGHLDIVTVLLKKGANINGRDSLGNTPLHYAVMCKRKPIVAYLLAKGANVKAINRNGNTILHEAGIISNIDLMQILFEHKVPINTRNNDGLTILHFVCRDRNVDIVRWVLDRGGNIQVQSLAGLSPLHIACSYNGKCDVESAKELMRRGANIQSTDIHSRTPLHRAAEVGLVEMVEVLLNNKADVSVKDVYGQTPFHLACTRSNGEVVKLLLNHGVDISEKNDDGETSLHIAAHHKNISVCAILIEKGIDLTATDNFGYTVLHIASERGTIETVQLLLDAKVDSKQQDIFGNTALHLASLKGYQSIAKLLMESNKNVLSIRNNYGKTPLHLGCEEGRYDLVKYLVKNGAEILAVDNYGKTPLHLASEFGRLKILKMLIDEISLNKNDLHLRDNFGRTLLHLSSLRGRHDVTECLLDLELKPDILDQRNSTPMHLACSSGHINIVNLLLERKADIMLIDGDMKTPLHLASEEGYSNIVGALFPKYTNIIILDSLGRTCLHLAAERGHKDVVRILVQNEILVFVKSMDQETPLHLAAKHGHADVVRILLTANAQVTIKDRSGCTAFHNAAHKGHLEIVKIFLKRGVVVDEFSDAGDTALHIAIKGRYLSIIKLLLRSGACTELKDGNGNTPLHLGVLQNNLEIVDVLLLHGADTSVLNNDEERAIDVAKRLKYSNLLMRMKPIKERKHLLSRIRQFLS